MLFEIAIRTPLRRLFTYESDRPLERGMRVKVPFRSKEVCGFVWNPTERVVKGLKKVAQVLDDTPFYDPKTLTFFERASAYYATSLGDLLATALPKKVKEGKPLKIPELKTFVPQLVKLSEKQKEIAEAIAAERTFKIHLLMGETGSGKTEIYLKLIERILLEGGQALVLVPEISLTPQLQQRLSKRLGGAVSVFHSKLTEKKREEVFLRALSGQSDLFLGARSALFLPFKNLQIIVVDEEHDGSYKQVERAPYHARDLAILRAQINDIPIVLGSATPSLESYSRAVEGNLPIYRLPPFFEKPTPEFKIVDLKKAWAEEKNRSFITHDLHQALAENLEKGEQSLLFLNRRGSASQRWCLKCGSVDECKHCSVTLTIHADLKQAICHWCGYKIKLTDDCVTCGSKHFFLGGIGTKEVEKQIRARFPEARIERLDGDKTATKDALTTILRDFEDAKIDILIGTQIISKGLDIPRLSLVGCLLADQGWGMPDFRATERSFQLLQQLMGRAGRRGQKSKFVVQTFSPDHPLFTWLQNRESFEEFANHELDIRKRAQLPPYARMSLWTLSQRDEKVLLQAGQLLGDRMKILGDPLGIQIMGPTFAPIARWKGMYRMHLLCKASPKGQMTTFMGAVLADLETLALPAEVKLDRDPYQFM